MRLLTGNRGGSSIDKLVAAGSRLDVTAHRIARVIDDAASPAPFEPRPDTDAANAAGVLAGPKARIFSMPRSDSHGQR
jgi:hypothetical protein